MFGINSALSLKKKKSCILKCYGNCKYKLGSFDVSHPSSVTPEIKKKEIEQETEDIFKQVLVFFPIVYRFILLFLELSEVILFIPFSATETRIHLLMDIL